MVRLPWKQCRMTFMHNDGYAVTKHGDDLVAVDSQQGVDSLKPTSARSRWEDLDQTVARRVALLGGSQSPGSRRNGSRSSA